MITYVNDVFVTNESEPLYAGNISALEKDDKSAVTGAGKIIIANADGGDAALDETSVANVKRIKIGLVTKKIASKVKYSDGSVKYLPVINWSNPIDKDAVRSYSYNPYAADVEQEIEFDFEHLSDDIKDKFNDGNRRLVVKITYKDLPNRFRKWTESYEIMPKSEYVAVGGSPMDYIEGLVKDIEGNINKQVARARVTVKADAKKLTFTAMKYDDDDSVNSISPAASVRFDVHMYWTDPTAAAFASNNKYELSGVKKSYTKESKISRSSAKLVRDREAAAMGYDGIINRGIGTLRETTLPELNVDLNGKYESITLLFENMYRAADDIFRKTKQTVEIYPVDGAGTKIDKVLKVFAQ